ncbi:hypothetical protein [Citrobacter koseri]|uniref:hypothetical protein n=1 Tax=Citrobacter koseri TaxID=545 RepID=UPI003D08C223
MFRTNGAGKSLSLDNPPFLTDPELAINTTITAVALITSYRYHRPQKQAVTPATAEDVKAQYQGSFQV